MKCSVCNGTGLVGDSRKLGAALRLKRKKGRVSLCAIADRMGYSIGYVCDLEHGRRTWTESLKLQYELALSLEVKK